VKIDALILRDRDIGASACFLPLFSRVRGKCLLRSSRHVSSGAKMRTRLER
jgi:hypothetical protein